MRFGRKSSRDDVGSTRSRWWRGTRRQDQPTLEPPHDMPWVPTSGLTDKVRRSPRE